MSGTELLRIENLNAWYGESHVLHGVNMSVNEGEVVSLLGSNGAGRTTTMRAIMGLTGSRAGSIRIRGQEAVKLPSHRIARLGVGYCPEERGIFASLSAEENLIAADLVDKLLVFVAPTLAGEGAGLVAALPEPRVLRHLTSEPVGDDVLLSAYVHEP